MVNEVTLETVAACYAMDLAMLPNMSHDALFGLRVMLKEHDLDFADYR